MSRSTRSNELTTVFTVVLTGLVGSAFVEISLESNTR